MGVSLRGGEGFDFGAALAVPPGDPPDDALGLTGIAFGNCFLGSAAFGIALGEADDDVGGTEAAALLTVGPFPVSLSVSPEDDTCGGAGEEARGAGVTEGLTASSWSPSWSRSEEALTNGASISSFRFGLTISRSSN